MSRARVSDIVALAAATFKVTATQIKGSRGDSLVCKARLAVYYVARLNHHSCAQIGMLLGDRDHSSVVDGRQSCMAKMDRDPVYRAMVEKIVARAAALPPFVPEKIYAGRVIPRKAPVFQPTKFFKPKPAPRIDAFNDDELLSRAVAAHYAGGADASR
jgi:hypothetical protein